MENINQGGYDRSCHNISCWQPVTSTDHKYTALPLSPFSLSFSLSLSLNRDPGPQAPLSSVQAWPCTTQLCIRETWFALSFLLILFSSLSLSFVPMLEVACSSHDVYILGFSNRNIKLIIGSRDVLVLEATMVKVFWICFNAYKYK